MYTRRVLRAVIVIVMLAGCYQPSFTNCKVRCDQTCPSGTQCGSDGFCHGAGDTIDCRTIADIDGGIDTPPGFDNCDPCQLVSQCGCPGEACDLGAGGTLCRATGNGIQATPCNALEHCANGYSCLGTPPSRACYEFCNDDSQCSGSGSICELTAGNTAQKVCSTSCNPLTSAGCPSGWGCHVAKNLSTSRDLTNCHFVQANGGQNASCSRLEDCQAGFACIQFSPPRCLKYCVVGGANACPTGTTCTSVGGGGFHIGSTEYGVCF